MPNTNILKREFATPILFIIFNRPDTAQKVFDEIRKAQPKYLYVAADGPREGNEQDERSCRESRAIIDQVDWNCEVKTLFQEKNIGCKFGPSSAINWFFDQVEAGIILEDDCVPHQSFFRFAGEMLEKYKDEDEVMMITGLNPITTYRSPASYYFSRHFSTWGWATWRRAWQKYDIKMNAWPQIKAGGLKKYYTNPNVRISMEHAFEESYLDRIDAWDYQWAFTGLIHNGLSVVPSRNLISNVGLYGAHFSGLASPGQNLPVFDLYERQIISPLLVEENTEYDSLFYKKMFHQNLTRKIRHVLAQNHYLRKLYHWIKDMRGTKQSK